MARKRRKFTQEFKPEAVRLCQVGGRSVGQVAKDLDLTETALRSWIKRITDVTYVWTVAGWLYLAVLLDLFSRRVVGWAISETNDRALALEAQGVRRRAERSPLGRRRP